MSLAKNVEFLRHFPKLNGFNGLGIYGRAVSPAGWHLRSLRNVELRLIPSRVLDVADSANRDCREADDEHERDEKRAQFCGPARKCEGRS